MKKILSFLFAVTLSITANAAEIGKPAPNFNLTDTNGNQVSLEGHKGKIIVLEWTNHECPFVKKHYDEGHMQALQKKYTEQGIHWISVISSAPGKQGHVDAETANQLTTSRNATPTHVILDESGELGQAYGAKTTPHMFIIDKQGVLAYKGAIDSIPSTNSDDIAEATNYVDVALTELLAGKPVTTKVTSQYGCSVKY